jgi:hypothetical protein
MLEASLTRLWSNNIPYALLNVDSKASQIWQLFHSEVGKTVVWRYFEDAGLVDCAPG